MSAPRKFPIATEIQMAAAQQYVRLNYGRPSFSFYVSAPKISAPDLNYIEPFVPRIPPLSAWAVLEDTGYRIPLARA